MEDYYDKLFDDIANEGNRRQRIDYGINTKDIFLDDDYLLDEKMHKGQKIYITMC